MTVNSTNNAAQNTVYAVSSRSGDVESAERRPDNEGAEASRAKAPLAAGQGSRIDIEA